MNEQIRAKIDEMRAHQNYYACLTDKLVECDFYDDCDVVKDGDSQWVIADLADFTYDGTTIRATRKQKVWERNEAAVEEFEALLDSWRARGWGDLADRMATDFAYEDEEPTPTTDRLQQLHEYDTSVVIENPKFFKREPIRANAQGYGLPLIISSNRKFGD